MCIYGFVRGGAWLAINTQSQSRTMQPELGEKKHPMELATANCDLKRSQISRLLKEKDPENISTTEDISDAIATAKQYKLNGLSNIYRSCGREVGESQLAIQV